MKRKMDKKKEIRITKQELDNSLTDLELKDIWNEMYDNYGYLMSDFKDQWEKEQLKGNNQTSFKHSKEFEELEIRVSELEAEVMKLKVQLLKPNRGLAF